VAKWLDAGIFEKPIPPLKGLMVCFQLARRSVGRIFFAPVALEILAVYTAPSRQTAALRPRAIQFRNEIPFSPSGALWTSHPHAAQLLLFPVPETNPAGNPRAGGKFDYH
jgi:hypothetical protein